jgi:hypothetical protein
VLYRPLIYNLLAIVISSFACSLFALPTYRSVIRSDVLRIAVCLALVGAIYTESLADNLCNSQWYLALGAFLIIFREPFHDKKHWASGVSALIVGLAALTNPEMVIAAPICLWKLIQKRNRAVATTLLVGVATQIIFFLNFPSPPAERANPTILAWAVAVAIIYKVVISTVAGWWAVTSVSNANAVFLFSSIFLTTVTWLVWLFLRLKPAKRVDTGGALYVALASVALALNGRGFFRAFSSPRHITEPRGEQYFFIAGCVFLYLLALTAERVSLGNWKHAEILAFCLIIGSGFYSNFEVPPFVDYDWAKEARKVQVWADKNRQTLPEVNVPINPGWTLPFPDSYREIKISGFPDHVVAAPSGHYVPLQLDRALFRDSGDLDYVYLPLFLGRNDRYHVQAIIEAEGSAVVELMIHGRLDHGAFARTAPLRVTNAAQIDTDVVTDPFGWLCFHLTHISGGAAKFTAITIRHL